ncbi:unnamed protein product [Rhizoctonia solani]|uniref:Inhibitor I9 domain-containing protein n=1 Tax=Rhizoctonia solani TaxID=456999 RepID=A0A8H3C2Z8_9AGAM|nr:unnamed protein product [Rhizoctonia solani]
MSESSTVPILRSPENTIPNQYLVMLKDHGDLASHLAWLQQRDSTLDGEPPKCKVIHQFEQVYKGYAAVLTKPVLEDLTKRDDVESIAEDSRPSW